MKTLYFLEYSFLVEEGTYISVGEFEKDLADFFAAHKVLAEFVDSKGGAAGKRIFLLRKMDFLEGAKLDLPPKKKKKTISPKKQLDKFRK